MAIGICASWAPCGGFFQWLYRYDVRVCCYGDLVIARDRVLNYAVMVKSSQAVVLIRETLGAQQEQR